MKHAILGAGGVGGLIGGALAHAGQPVTLLVRPGRVESHPRRLSVESPLLGSFEADVQIASAITALTDVLWITVKSVDLEAALALVPASAVADAVVIPLMNGIEHLERLRAQFGMERVVAGAIRVESERVAPGKIQHISQFAVVDLAPPPALRASTEAILAELRATGLGANLRDDEDDVMWNKLAMLAPNALTTSAANGPVGLVRSTPRWQAMYEACVWEACALAEAEGVHIDAEALIAATAARFENKHRTSMQKDIEAGRTPELDAIGGALLRAAQRHQIPAPVTAELVQLVAERAGLELPPLATLH
jgi:2-dehydropantoate 2-reductase